jgi:hypothetical protein
MFVFYIWRFIQKFPNLPLGPKMASMSSTVPWCHYLVIQTNDLAAIALCIPSHQVFIFVFVCVCVCVCVKCSGWFASGWCERTVNWHCILCQTQELCFCSTLNAQNSFLWHYYGENMVFWMVSLIKIWQTLVEDWECSGHRSTGCTGRSMESS